MLLTLGKRLGKLVGGVLMLLGALLLFSIWLATTPYSYRLHRDLLSQEARDFQGAPDYIIMLGGGGMPSGSTLIRCWHTAQWAAEYPDATIIIALPYDGPFEGSSAWQVARELQLRGVQADRILSEPAGRNTREQALNTAAMVEPDAARARCLLITSPDHMRRSVLSFRKAGFETMRSPVAFSRSIETDLAYRSSELDRERPRVAVPDAGGSPLLRYGLWMNFMYQIDIVREVTALLYYRMRGWI